MSSTLSKEEILSNHEYDVHYYGGGRRHILEAMDIFAQQESRKEAIGFVGWYYPFKKKMCEEAANKSTFSFWVNKPIEDYYDLYLQSKQKQ